MERHFSSALLKLTAWYMLIVFVICVGFSLIIFSLASAEFDRRLPPNPDASYNQQIDQQFLETIRSQRAAQSRSRLAGSLLVVNIGALTLGGFGSYLLARRTLRPIQEAAAAQGRFISDASHELRTPLAVMQSEIEVALRGTPTKAGLTALARSNLEEVNRLRGLSDRLLQLGSEAPVTLAPVIVEQAVSEAVTPHFAQADARAIRIVNKTDASVALAAHDNLKDVLSILIDNALKYAAADSTLTLRSRTVGRSVFIDVCDKGPGIPEADLPYIFDRFYRADSSRTTQSTNGEDIAGYGLGLAIARQIVERMRGELTAKSQPGKGSVFTVKLDAASANLQKHPV